MSPNDQHPGMSSYVRPPTGTVAAATSTIASAATSTIASAAIPTSFDPTGTFYVESTSSYGKWLLVYRETIIVYPSPQKHFLSYYSTHCRRQCREPSHDWPRATGVDVHQPGQHDLCDQVSGNFET